MGYQLSLPNYNIKIKGVYISLVPLSDSEVCDKYVSWLNDPVTNKYLEVRHKIQTKLSLVNYINELRKKQGCEIFGIFINKSDEFVGNIAITNYDDNNKRLETGTLVGEDRARSIGIGALATMVFYEYIFNFTDIKKVFFPIVDENINAWRLQEKLGSKREGVLRKHFILSPNNVKDVYVYGILKDEWERVKKHNSYINKNTNINIKKLL